MTPLSSTEPAAEVVPRTEGRKAAGPSALRHFIIALSIAHLTFIYSWHGLLSERYFGYCYSIPVNRPSLGAVLLNIAALTIVLWLLGRFLQRANHGALWTFANMAICALSFVPLNFARTNVLRVTGADIESILRHPLTIALGITVVLAALWFHRYTAKAVMVAYLVLSPLAFLTLGKTTWWLIQPPPAPQHASTVRPRSATDKPGQPGHAGPRVVWMLFDELDQRVAFESRPADILLPEITRFYAECFRATNAFPPGGYTRYSLPALIMGQEVRRVLLTSPSELMFNGSARWSQSETVFSRARSLGYSTALVGWFHPYSRVIGHHLDYCEWFAYPPFQQERGRTLPEAALNQVCSIFSQFQQRRLHIQNFKASEAASLLVLTNSLADLTLLHLPIPHHPGIYDARRNRLTLWKYSRHREYLENLVLADHLFARFRRAMEQNGSWDKTWIILSSDHWWREANHYHGAIDHRVPFIVKAPGQNEPVVYDRKFNTLLTHHLILSVLKGELTTASQLPQWMDIFRSDPPSGYAIDGAPL